MPFRLPGWMWCCTLLIPALKRRLRQEDCCDLRPAWTRRLGVEALLPLAEHPSVGVWFVFCCWLGWNLWNGDSSRANVRIFGQKLHHNPQDEGQNLALDAGDPGFDSRHQN
ncbi:uncharacterized protein KIAA1551 homolog isoform X3 [Octodon degus]|uniref:Uncharacterized protein KIAA1551 homolog isoform X3 n=1 Tax=Octodon degus TaxID=10160 RepID=A0A6P6EI66_OCTDE|nr:uncharacterized protein KIAA1551 homolog isoform X3 [Octodon degus]